MTYKIKKSVADVLPNFKKAVEIHARDLKAWHEQMANVKKDPKNFQPYDPPWAPEEVDRAVRRPDFVPDYEIVDDGPSPEEVLQQKKKDLTNQVSLAHHEAVGRVLPHGKHLLAQLRYNGAASKNERDRTKADKQVMAEHEARQEQLQALQLQLAEALAEVEDLTAATVDRYKVPKFP